MLAMLNEVFAPLEQPDGEDHSSDEQILFDLHSFVLDPKNFVVGNIKQHLVAWQCYFARYGNTVRSSQVLHWIAHGVRLEFVNPFAPGQDKHPHFKQKLQFVQSLLHRT